MAKTLGAGDEDLANDIVGTETGSHGGLPSLRKMRRIVERAADNVATSASEAAWNCGGARLLVRGGVLWER